MTGSNAWIAPIVIALVSAVVAYAGLLRKSSGRISTTEAGKLWDEAENLREVYRAELARLRTEIDRLDAEVAACEDSLREHRFENDELLRENRRLKRRLEEIGNHAAV